MFSKFGNVFLWKMDVDPFFRFMFVHASSWNDKSKGKEINLCVFFKVIIRNEATALPEI